MHQSFEKVLHVFPIKQLQISFEEYGIYSRECAEAMAKVGFRNTGADLSIGVTGTFSNVDPHNDDSVSGVVYFSVINLVGKVIAKTSTL
ncbi:CinA family protein [Desulfitobacterium sp.]|uniref:CinA family protein n=1 Tax=Desulfitobacterium sp. TaxID=49981 RepID=UPI002B21FA07|nr:CinA family protein [Desulfitobacterium sp.]MEA4901313.1 CinA family protein [Desulfitobacterium sp.]